MKLNSDQWETRMIERDYEDSDFWTHIADLLGSTSPDYKVRVVGFTYRSSATIAFGSLTQQVFGPMARGILKLVYRDKQESHPRVSRKLSKFGDWMPLREFTEGVRNYRFTPETHLAYYANEAGYDPVSDVWVEGPPFWATHVMVFDHS